MRQLLNYKLSPSEAALWWLGQSGYLIQSMGLNVVIDPYLSNAAAKDAPELSRLYAAPFMPIELEADIYIVTHDHMDHLDPDLIPYFIERERTQFVAPRQAASKLALLGIPENRITVLHAGERCKIGGIEVRGVFALPTGVDVLDTTGYFVKFGNGRSFYHTSDTQFHPIVQSAAPMEPEVLLVPINGKWGNPGPEQAAVFAKAIQPKYVMPNHYDLMELNSENPATFKWFCTQYGMADRCIIPERMQPFVWGF